jgi:small-conductance mechanosensitive channel
MTVIVNSVKRLMISFIILIGVAFITVMAYNLFISGTISGTVSENNQLNEVIGLAIIIGFWSIILLFIRRTRPLMAKHLGEQTTTLLQLIMAAIAILFMIFAVLYVLHVEAQSLLTGAGFASITIGLIVSTFVGGILAGALVFATHKLRVGDTVIVNNVPGIVTELTALVTRIRTDVGFVTIPNSAISSGAIVITKLQKYDGGSFARLPYAVGDRVATTLMPGEGTVKSITALRTVLLLDSGRELTILNNSVFSGAVTIAKLTQPKGTPAEKSA